ncbi:hypothetical protein PMAYCL1PPCAC_30322, partial [Pristionchus mayeri]
SRIQTILFDSGSYRVRPILRGSLRIQSTPISDYIASFPYFFFASLHLLLLIPLPFISPSLHPSNRPFHPMLPYLILSISVLLPSSLCSNLCNPNGFEMTDLESPKVCARIAELVNGAVKISPPKDAFYLREQFEDNGMQSQSKKIHCLQKGAHQAVFGCTSYDCHQTESITYVHLVECGMSLFNYPFLLWLITVCVWPVILLGVLIGVYKRKVFVRYFRERNSHLEAVKKVNRHEQLRQRIIQETARREAEDEQRRADEAEKAAAAEMPREDTTQE